MLDVRALLTRLLDHSVGFVIVGGIAAVAHGSPQMTADLDVCYSRAQDSLEKLVAALASLKPTLRGAPPGLPFVWEPRTLRSGLNFTLDTNLGPIDLLGEVAGIGQYDDALAASEILLLFDRPCRVLTLEALIRSKRAAGRKRDLEHVLQLEALRELQEKPDRE
jgi:hypothetical protein